MDFTAFRMTAAEHLAAFEATFRDRESSDEAMEYDFEQPDEREPPFSIRSTVECRGERFSEESIDSTCAEFLEMFEIADPVLKDKSSGRPFHLPPIDQFFVLIHRLTSGSTVREIANRTTLSKRSLARVIKHDLGCHA
jgi:hypothetical protein